MKCNYFYSHFCGRKSANFSSSLIVDLPTPQAVRFVPEVDVKVNYLSGQVYAYRTKAISFLVDFLIR